MGRRWRARNTLALRTTLHAQQLTQAAPPGYCDKRPAGGPGWPTCTRAARSGSPVPPVARRRAPVRRPPPRARAGRRRARGPPPPHVRRAPPQHPARPAARGAAHERGRFAASEAALQTDSGRARCRVARRLAGGRRRRAPHRLEQDGQQAWAASSCTSAANHAWPQQREVLSRTACGQGRGGMPAGAAIARGRPQRAAQPCAHALRPPRQRRLRGRPTAAAAAPRIQARPLRLWRPDGLVSTHCLSPVSTRGR